jgi:hypothetical protein
MLTSNQARRVVVSVDPYLNELLIAYSEEALARPQSAQGIRPSDIESVIPSLLPHGPALAPDSVPGVQAGLSQRVPAAFFLAALVAIGAGVVKLEDI